MLYDIYFHNDFDGRASAAVMLNFLRSRGDDIEHYVPVKYDIIPQWLDEHFFEKHKLFKGKRNPAIIVDFPYHPGTKFWFEHHPTTFKKESWQKNFKPTKYLHYEPKYKSACHVVYAALQNDFGWKPPKHFVELVRWLDIIDGADYASARQTIEMKEPAIQVNNFIEEKSEDLAATIRTIKALSQESLAQFSREPAVKKVVQKLRRDTQVALTFYKNKLEKFGKVMVIDLSLFPFRDLGHYAPYYLYPKLLYAIRFHPFPGRKLFHVNVGSNPWRKLENKKDIGELLREYGGGGHFGVGGVEFKSKKETLQAIQEFITFLNR